MIKEMAAARRSADQQACNVTRFKVSDKEARTLAIELNSRQLRNRPTTEDIYRGIKAGAYRVFGIPVEFIG